MAFRTENNIFQKGQFFLMEIKEELRARYSRGDKNSFMDPSFAKMAKNCKLRRTVFKQIRNQHNDDLCPIISRGLHNILFSSVQFQPTRHSRARLSADRKLKDFSMINELSYSVSHNFSFHTTRDIRQNSCHVVRAAPT